MDDPKPCCGVMPIIRKWDQWYIKCRRCPAAYEHRTLQLVVSGWNKIVEEEVTDED